MQPSMRSSSSRHGIAMVTRGTDIGGGRTIAWEKDYRMLASAALIVQVGGESYAGPIAGTSRRRLEARRERGNGPLRRGRRRRVLHALRRSLAPPARFSPPADAQRRPGGRSVAANVLADALRAAPLHAKRRGPSVGLRDRPPPHHRSGPQSPA